MRDAISARDLAVWVLGCWRLKRGRPESLINEAFTESHLDARDRRLVMELVHGVVRNLTNLDYIISHFVKETKKGVSPEISDILRVAAYQVVYLDRVPAHAAVNEAVRQAKESRGQGAAGFVNAVMRSLIRDMGKVKYPDPGSDPVGWLSVKYSWPAWLSARWLHRFGFEGAHALIEASNRVPPLTLRANAPFTSREELVRLFEEGGVKCTPGTYAPDAVIVGDNRPVRELPGYADGMFSVQDEAAQVVGALIAPRAGDMILDACAAPGGKAAHLSALSSGRARVVAMDINLDKLRLVKENIKRLRASSVTVVAGDAGGPLPVKAAFDGILLDAPCTALGVIRRRPEIKYLRSEGDITRMAGVQAGMLSNLAGYVRQGGAMVYSVCSTEPEEGEFVVEDFLAGHKDFVIDDIRPFLPEAARPLVTGDGYLRTFPHMQGMDGFFAARMRRI
jgi:16S rRNA (cytosine967-C5)-methyltransferase